MFQETSSMADHDHDRAPQSSRLRSTSITLPNELHADLLLLAQRRLSSVSQAIRELTQEGLKREDPG
jgi:metal-responsive CopG/Arc/MetJ family transcriptional regulator